jgi:beta-glucosidase/6-phospho-beta-glucosidase/beta-galactosidase
MGRTLLALLLAVLACAPAAAAERFPRGFLWGTATAGFQSEAGGRPSHADHGSDWWVWSRDRANIAAGRVSGHRVEDGPGFWRRWRGDVGLARRGLHSNAMRIGIEWSRIFPRSTRGASTMRELDRLADHTALRHYRRVLRRIRARHMEPFVTIDHFSLPTWIHDPIAARDALARVGPDDPVPSWPQPRGWLDRSTAGEFAKYSGYLAARLGGLVTYWMPINEPMVVATSGYVNVPGAFAGNFPPGALSYPAAIAVVENLVRANAAAYDAVHRHDRRARVGLVQNLIAFTGDDAAAVDHADRLFNRLFLDAAIRGELDRDADGTIDPGEHEAALRGKADFLGVNYYFRGRVTPAGGPLTPAIPLLDFVPATSYAPITTVPCPTLCSDFGSEIFPEGFAGALRTAGSYGLPVYITENGIADATDRLRPAFLRDHLRVLAGVIDRGEADVRGYFAWSLTDNLEWSTGYRARFGLYAYNPRTLERTPRVRSVRLVARVARTNTVP